MHQVFLTTEHVDRYKHQKEMKKAFSIVAIGMLLPCILHAQTIKTPIAPTCCDTLAAKCCQKALSDSTQLKTMVMYAPVQPAAKNKQPKKSILKPFKYDAFKEKMKGLELGNAIRNVIR